MAASSNDGAAFVGAMVIQVSRDSGVETVRRHLFNRAVPVAAIFWLTGCAINEQAITSQNESNWSDADSAAITAAEPELKKAIMPSTHFAAGQLFERQGAMRITCPP